MVIKNSKKYIEDKKSQNLYGWDDLPASHPGETLNDEIQLVGLTQAEVAARAGCTVQTINRIVKEREPITPSMALKLERIFEGRPSAKFWLNMQSSYDQDKALIKEEAIAEEEIGFFKKHLKDTFKELQNIGICEKMILRTDESYKKAVMAIKNFFETATLESIRDKNIMGVAFRKYNRDKINQYNLAAILKIGEKKARNILKHASLNEYDPKTFSSKLADIKNLTKRNPAYFLPELQEKCLQAGVMVIYAPNMIHTHFGGATTWLSGHPVIILKVENQREDVFWFNFFHEAAHVLKHSKKEFFIDFENGEKTDIEKEADNFAQEKLIPNFSKIADNLKSNIDIESWLKESAQAANVSLGIIAGRACNDMKNKSAWKHLSKFRPIIKEKVQI